MSALAILSMHSGIARLSRPLALAITTRPHTCIRGFKYKVPVPDDVPHAVRAVLTLPPHATCKAFSRLKANEREARAYSLKRNVFLLGTFRVSRVQNDES